MQHAKIVLRTISTSSSNLQQQQRNIEMGNCGSDQVRHAIKQDGEQNVVKTAILTANQYFIEKVAQQIKPSYQREIAKKLELKKGQIADARQTINQKLQEKKIDLEKQETGTIEYLTSKHNTSFEGLSGYALAMEKIDDFEHNATHIYAAESKKIPEDIEKYKEDIKFELDKLKQPLPGLMSFGVEKKEKILAEVAKHHQTEVDESNKKLEEDMKKEFEFSELYRKRCEQWVPKYQLDEIVRDFEVSLEQLHTKKSGKNGFLCF